MKTNVSWNKVLEPPGYKGPNPDLMHGQGNNPRAGWTSCASHKMVLCERDAVPRKIWDLVFLMFLLFFFFPGSLKLSLLMESLRVVLFISVLTISILILFPFLLPLPFFPLYALLPLLPAISPTILVLFALPSLPHVGLAHSSGHPPQFPCRLSMIFLSFLSLCSSASFFLLSVFYY